MQIKRLFQKTLFGIIAMLGVIGLSTSWLAVDTVEGHLSEEYVSNSRNIAKTIADASVDILLNRDLATLQSLIDQFLGIQGIKYIYINNEDGEYMAHTFVPGIPEEIRNSDPLSTETVNRDLPGIGACVEVGSPILAGEAGTVHVGMDRGLITLKISAAIGQQVWLIGAAFILGVGGAIWFVHLAAKPIGQVLAYASTLAKSETVAPTDGEALLEREDEAGDLARLFQFFAGAREPPSTGAADAPPGAASAAGEGESAT